MPLKGALRDFSLPDLFQLIHFGKKNGTLVIANGDMMGYVCFRNGNVFFATHNWKRAPLGQRLIEAGMVTQEQLDEALELQNTTHGDQRVGNILVELGHLSRESLEVFVEEHIRDAVFNLLRWNEGDFDFDPDQIFPEEDIGLSMSTEDLIMEGSRRLDEWFQIEKKVPSLDSVFKMMKVPGKDASEMNLTSEEWLVVYHVDGDSTVRDIIAKSGQSALVTCKALYGLVTAGLVSLAGGAAEVAAGAAGLEDEVGHMLEEEAAAAPGADRDTGATDEEITIEEVEPEGEAAEEERRPKRLSRSRKKQVELEDEVISFGDEVDESVTIEEVATDEPEAAAPRRSKLRRKGKKAGEPSVEETGEPETVLVEEEAGEPAEAEAREDEPSAGRETASQRAPDGAPAPGQSLVDYYKSLALRDFGDSEIYRETEERRAFIEQADRGELEEDEQHEFEILGSEAQEGSAALTDEPRDIPMEWAGHLTRLRGRSSQPSRGKARKPAGEDDGGEPEAEVVELDAYAAAREDAARVEEALAGEPAVEPDIEDEAAGAHAGSTESGPEDAASIEEVEPVLDTSETEPVVEIIDEEVGAQAELIDESDIDDDIMAGALEAISGTGAADIPEEDGFETEEQPAATVSESHSEEPESVDEPEPEDDEISPADAEEEVPLSVDAMVEEAVQAAADIPEVPTIDESAAIDEASLPTEEEIERLIQVNPPSREDLSREELLAFDKPTYAIQESRDGGPAQGEGPVESGAQPAAADQSYAELEETASRAAAGDSAGGGPGPAGQVISFSGAAGDVDVEVVLEHPEPVVRSATVEVLSTAEDLKVPVVEEVLGQTVARLEEPLLEEATLEEEPEVHAAAGEAQTASPGDTGVAGDEEITESVLEIVGLEESSADVIPLDSARPSAAVELEVDSPEAEAAELHEEVAEVPVSALEAEAEEIEETVAEDDGELQAAEYATAVELEVTADELLAAEDAIAEEISTLEPDALENSEQEPIVTAGAAEAQPMADWGDSEAEAAEAVDEHVEGIELALDYDHLEDLRDITAGELEAEVEETQVEEPAPELEIQAEAVDADFLYEEDEEDDDDGGLMGSLKVSGKRGKGTSLVDLETFELEQELLELAGGVQQKKHKVAIDKTQPKPDSSKKEKRGRAAGRSKGKEVDKGSVKKIIDDLKKK